MRMEVRGVIVGGGLSGRGGYDRDDDEVQLCWTSVDGVRRRGVR